MRKYILATAFVAIAILGGMLSFRQNSSTVEAARILTCPENPEAHFAISGDQIFWECPKSGKFHGHTDIETYSHPLYPYQILFVHSPSEAVCHLIEKMIPPSAQGYQGCDFSGWDKNDGSAALMAKYDR